VSVKEPWLDTAPPVPDLLIAIFSWIAEQERRRISERTKIGLDRARRMGKQLGRAQARVSLLDARALLATGLTRARAAQKLGVSETTLRRTLRETR
jgi:DNA invertase Pin-like site-specific DNA recombinase